MYRGLVNPVQIAYQISTVTTYWHNHRVLEDILQQAGERFANLIIETQTEKRWFRKDHHLHIRGPAWQIRVFTESLLRWTK